MIVCSGKLGRLSLEDAAFAGWLAHRLTSNGFELDDAAARCAARIAPRDSTEIRAVLEGSAHGRYLRALGGEFLRDVGRCAELDTIERAFEL
jgi:phosphosulfolactate phosphohydrolase-like enzyme